MTAPAGLDKVGCANPVVRWLLPIRVPAFVEGRHGA